MARLQRSISLSVALAIIALRVNVCLIGQDHGWHGKSYDSCEPCHHELPPIPEDLRIESLTTAVAGEEMAVLGSLTGQPGTRQLGDGFAAIRA